MVSDDDTIDGGNISIDDPADKAYKTASGTIIPATESNNPEKVTEVKKLIRRLKIVRETIAYKQDQRQYMDQMMLDLAYSETLPTEFCFYRLQELEDLIKHEERLIRDLACLGYDASRDNERPREEFEAEELNSPVDLDDSGEPVDEDTNDDDDDIDFLG